MYSIINRILWTSLFFVLECMPQLPSIFKLKDADDKPIQGNFYEAEFQKVKLGKRRSFMLKLHLDQRRP